VTARTLAKPATFAGVTLFTGVKVSIMINPAGGGGIVFRRADLPGSPPIPADSPHIVPESRRTVLSANPADPKAPTVQTVEHLMSALAGLAITHALVEVHGPEIPIGDGSSQPFADTIAAAGIAPADREPQHAPAVVSHPIVIEDPRSRIEALPGARPGLELTYRLQYPAGSPIPAQEAHLYVPLGEPAPDYREQIAPARTFCLEEEAHAMRKMGLFTHLSPREMLVIGERGPIDNAYRFPDEPARHKLLDLLGDLALAARPIHARIIATRTGHAHNHAMAKALAAL